MVLFALPGSLELPTGERLASEIVANPIKVAKIPSGENHDENAEKGAIDYQYLNVQLFVTNDKPAPFFSKPFAVTATVRFVPQSSRLR
jgi:hypothetical protein